MWPPGHTIFLPIFKAQFKKSSETISPTILSSKFSKKLMLKCNYYFQLIVFNIILFIIKQQDFYILILRYENPI